MSVERQQRQPQHQQLQSMRPLFPSRPGHRALREPRPAPTLQHRQRCLQELLQSGCAYDAPSVAEAVGRANALFEARKVVEAEEAYEAAYELARLTYDYRPLLFDLAVRMALCLLLGALPDSCLAGSHPTASRAWSILEVAEHIIPNTDVVRTIKGLAHLIASVLRKEGPEGHNLELAVEWLLSAVRLRKQPKRRELQHFAECLLATAAWARGDCEGALKTTSAVLSRTSGYVFALVVRGDACKFHPSGHFEREAREDYAEALRQDVGLREMMGVHFELTKPVRLVELALRFHPTLCSQGPTPYETYPMFHAFSRRSVFGVFAWVVMFVARLKACWRSTKLLRSMQAQVKGLWTDVTRPGANLARWEQSQHEIWGPADPDARVHRYRRYWLEKPLPLAERVPPADDVEESRPAPKPCAAAPEARAREPAAPPAAKAPAARAVGVAAAPSERQSAEVKKSGGHPVKIVHEPDDVAAVFLAKTDRYLPKPFADARANWGEELWLARALELARESERDTGGPIPDCDLEPRSVPADDRPPPHPESWVTMAVPKKGQGLVQVELTRALGTLGLEGLPDWFPELDRINELTEPAPFLSPTEQAVAVESQDRMGREGKTTRASRSMRSRLLDDDLWESDASRCAGWRSHLRSTSKEAYDEPSDWDASSRTISSWTALATAADPAASPPPLPGKEAH